MNLTSHTTLGGAKHATHTAGYITSGPAEGCAGILAKKQNR